MTYSNDGGEQGPAPSEHEDVLLGPATPGTLEAIENHLQQLLAGANEHSVVEYVVISDGNPVIFKKHLEAKLVTKDEVEIDYPLGELTFYDQSCDRMAVSYVVHRDMSVVRKPGYLNGYNWCAYAWSIDLDGRVTHADTDDIPRQLTPAEAKGLSSLMFSLLGVEEPNVSTEASLTSALDIAASRGISAIEKGQLHLLRGKYSEPTYGRDWAGNDIMTIKAVEREQIQPGLEAAQRYKVIVARFIEPEIKEIDELTVYENGLAEYKYGQSDFGKVRAATATRPEMSMGEIQDRIDETNRYIEFAQMARAAGLHEATEEQASRMASLLQGSQALIKA